jgi:putative transposase
MKKIKLKLPKNNRRKAINELKSYFHSVRKIYNDIIDYSKENKENINKIHLTSKFITTKSRNGDINDYITPEMEKIPKEIRRSSVYDFVSSYKACLTKIKDRKITSFTFNYRKKKNPTQTIQIPSSAIKITHKKDKTYEIKIFSRILKYTFTIKEKTPDFKIDHDCKLIWSYPDHFHLCIPYKKEKEEGNDKNETIALDPGVRKFQVCFSQKEIIKINPDKEKLKKLKDKIDFLKSKRDKNLRKLILSKEAKIRNKIVQLHYDSIQILKEYNNILLPSFDSQEMIGKNNKLYSSAKRDMNILSHYKFKERLIASCSLKENCNVYIVDEAYTSKTCSFCGKLNNCGKEEIYNCESCKYSCDRDVNGARNIFLKYCSS